MNLATFRAGLDSNTELLRFAMIVVTSVFVADVTTQLRSDSGLRSGTGQWSSNFLDPEQLQIEGMNLLEESARELISMYEGKNRVEPIE
jgi:hypothetical protein